MPRSLARARGALVAIGASFAVLGAAASASAAPAFSDGSFEAPATGGASFMTIPNGGTIGPWAVTAGDVDLVGGTWMPADGNQSVDLDGTMAGTICQTYDAASAGNGKVTFSESHNPFAPAGSLDVIVDGNNLGSFVHNTPNALTGMQWQQHSVTFTPTGATTTLCFKSTTPGGAGPALDNVQLTASADLGLTKTAPATVLHGQNVTYTLTVKNNGPDTAAAPSVVDTLPAGQALVSSDAGCAGMGTTTATCTLAAMPNASLNTIHIVASTTGIASPLAPPGLTQTNSATVSSTTLDPGPTANTGTAMVTVLPSADLTQAKTATPNPAIAGQTVTYTLTTTNLGLDTAVNAKVVDTLPAGVTLVNEGDEIEGNNIGGALDCKNNTPPPVDDGAANTVGGARLGQCANLAPSAPPAPGTQCTQAGNVVTCPLGNITAGASAARTLKVVSAAGTPMNTATASSDTGDPDLTNNTGTATTTVTTSCTSTVTGLVTTAIIVPSGTFLCANNAVVLGAIIVKAGGGFTSTNSILQGSLTSDGAVFVTLCNNQLRAAAAVVIKNTVLTVRVGDEATGCGPNTLAGSLTATANLGGVEIADNTIRGSVTYQDNTHT